MRHEEVLRQKIEDRAAVIGIYGLGYVGLPLAIGFINAGFSVVGFDVDEEKVASLSAGHSYIAHVDIAALNASDGRFTATTDFSQTSKVDVLIICVPTPLNAYREPDISFIINTVNAFQPYLRAGQLVSLESTTYPGTTEEELKPLLEAVDLKVGEEIFLVYSPEREDPGNVNFSTRTIPKICGGITQACLELGELMYQQVIDRVVCLGSTQAAELTKLLENIHRAVNIGLVNELKVVADRMNIDIHEVIDAAATKPFGFVPYYPGPGLGGHCIPVDPFYLTWKAREFGLHTRFIELAGEVNSGMPSWVMQKISEALNEQGKPIKNSRILIIGIAYKKNVDDMRESPAVTLMELLRDQGAVLDYCDPHVPRFPKMREHHFEMSSIDCHAQDIASYDCVVLVTDHDVFDYDALIRNAKLLVDTRGVYRQAFPNLVKA